MSGALVGKDKSDSRASASKEASRFQMPGADLGHCGKKVGGRWSRCWDLGMGRPHAVRREQ